MICKTCGKDIPDYTQHLCPGKDQNKGSYSTQPKQMEKINKCGCPHSNVKPYLNSGTRHKLWSIHCKSCNCEMYFYETESEAIEAWNTAHPDYEQQIAEWKRMYYIAIYCIRDLLSCSIKPEMLDRYVTDYLKECEARYESAN